MSNSIITSEILVAYSQCPRKAFLLLFAEDKGLFNEYMQVLEQKKNNNRTKYIDSLRKSFQIEAYSQNALYKKNDYLFEANLVNDSLLASCDLLKKVEGKSNFGKYSYEAIIVGGTYTVTNEQKLKLLFASYVLKQIQKKLPTTGSIISLEGKVHNLETKISEQKLKSFLEPLKKWIKQPPSEETPVILNKHCPYCQFQASCRDKANKSNNLSLLDRMTAKSIQKYHKKGIFTITQLSYLFKPRRRNKRANKTPIKHRFELQALALRTGKIYLQDIPIIVRQEVEIFLDIEGIPDQNFYYLIGLLISVQGKVNYSYFWADNLEEEEKIWIQLIEKIKCYPESPIYHYGSYEPKALKKLAKRYLDEDNYKIIEKRLVNVNQYIYGQIYFPVYSNSLKELGRYVGASWSKNLSSGLESLVYRYRWEENYNKKIQQILITYNQQDCQALKIVTDFVSSLKEISDTDDQIDFIHQPKQCYTEKGKLVHRQLEIILKTAHWDYDKNKISLRFLDKQKNCQRAKKTKSPKSSRTSKQFSLNSRKPDISIDVKPLEYCPVHLRQLKVSKYLSFKTIGVLVSDFYPGYDSLDYQQQKCWVHLIRDLNDDLWKFPFDSEYEKFILAVRDLIVPIYKTIETYGLQQQKLIKYKSNVEEFYQKIIVDHYYQSELSIKYQKRFIRYRNSLFTFLEKDRVKWHNNMAENAIRHLAKQRDISLTFSKSITPTYLRLLGIKQSCKFQSKSFLKFLQSENKDIDKFKEFRRIKN